MQNTVACNPCDHVNKSLHVCSDVKADHSKDRKEWSEHVASASKTPKPSLHTENCMLGSGGIVGDVILFGFVT